MEIRVLAGLAALALLFALSPATAPADEEQVKFAVEVVEEATGDGIANASVYVKFKEERFLRKDKKREWSLKTDPDGRAEFPSLPEGRVLVQVVAKGWKTYGRYHELKGPRHTLEVRLQPAKRWY
jgi:hypothetical protein